MGNRGLPSDKVMNLKINNLILFSIKTFLFCSTLIPIFVFGNWPNWRGPNFDGSSQSTSSLPEIFDDSVGVKWKTRLPGSSAATPIIYEDRVFVPSISITAGKKSEGRGELRALCLDAKSGKVLWDKNAGSGYRPGQKDGFDFMLHDRSNYASPSPVIGDDSVFFFYGNGDLLAFDFDGNKKWSRNLQKDYGDFCFQWTFSASPTYWKKKLYLPILQRNEPVHGRGKENAESYILCIDPLSGKTLWRHVRDSNAQKESLESFGTIIPFDEKLYIAGGDVLTSHHPDTGEELWRWGTWNPGHKEQWWRLVPSPVIGGGVALVCAPKRAPVFAIKLNESEKGGEGRLRWETSADPLLTSDVPTPLFYRKKFYILSDLKKKLFQVDPQTGSTQWSVDLPGKYKWRSSPTAGDGKIYIMNHNAMVIVVSASSGKILNQAEMGGSYDDNTRSSIAISQANLYIRTNENLYCIE